MMIVPLMVVASRAVGLASRGNKPNAATQTMTMRPSKSWLQQSWSELDEGVEGTTSSQNAMHKHCVHQYRLLISTDKAWRIAEPWAGCTAFCATS